ncbi:hypothetical protein GWK47_026231 [Chionoecetes opilio]|uniref:Uncharacterized protein n=1 Tax=Chionoecetes opilio TaxID=41210 RepID=A0A8J8WCL8_CHIOP|nr:hypothetical protein GWK47_026231 [Chionoecetes opilio]
MSTTLGSWCAAPARMSPAPRCAPNTAPTSSSTSVATAAQWPCSSASAPPTSVTPATMTFSASPTYPRLICPAALPVPAPTSRRARSVPCTCNIHPQGRSLPWAVEFAATLTPSEGLVCSSGCHPAVP